MPVAKVCCVAKHGAGAPAAVVFSSTDTVSELLLARRRSGRPSPFPSALDTERVLVPVAGVAEWETSAAGAPTLVVALSAVVFSSTDTVLELALARRRSGRPSPFTSAADTEAGRVP